MQSRLSRTNDTALVLAARAGDRGALDELVRTHLPLVYNLTRQALGGHPDVDDVVQEVMLRMVRQLPALRSAKSFRPWLTAITVHQIGTQLARGRVAAARTADLDELAGLPDAGAEPEGATLLRVELSVQRRQVMHAGRWLSADERTVLALWWLETVGELTRTDVAVALGVKIAHAGVRLQRMRDHLETARSIVAALDAVPGCGRLSAVVAGWDGVPSPFWRKRIERHLRSCSTCGPAREGLLPTERLLAGFALLPVPPTLAGEHVPVEAFTRASTLGRWGAALRAHPVGAALTAGALAAGLVVTMAGWSSLPPVARAVLAGSPSPTPAPLLKIGKVSLESANAKGQFVALSAGRGVLAPAGATLEVVPGLAGRGCFSLRTADGMHLRHASWRLVAGFDDGTALFHGDATFCPRAGLAAGSVALESANYPGWFLRHVDGELWVDQLDGSAGFRADSSFLVRPPRE
ncbi:sigma-70 family RNA polymerase sigma factor [Actinoplanes sp. NPDC048967]|uniref:sigma-70 family RNA polymerase sigma factor n=1 Tax=Actinoplanes sp. NPDC048967 TaxID=3155269 RepID=UPI0033F71474